MLSVCSSRHKQELYISLDVFIALSIFPTLVDSSFAVPVFAVCFTVTVVTLFTIYLPDVVCTFRMNPPSRCHCAGDDISQFC